MSRVLDIDIDKSEWTEVQKNVGQIQNNFNDTEIKAILRKMGAAIKKEVRSYAPQGSDSLKAGEKHIKDDVTYKVKKDTNGNYYVSVRGGKTTGYKWNWVNGGHVAQNGRFVPGNHFVDKAEIASESAINSILDDFLKKVVD